MIILLKNCNIFTPLLFYGLLNKFPYPLHKKNNKKKNTFKSTFLFSFSPYLWNYLYNRFVKLSSTSLIMSED